MLPRVTNNDESDITVLEALRVTLNKENYESGVKVTMLAFLIKAVVAGLKKFPEFNASLDDDQLVYKQYYHIGFAADTPNGLVRSEEHTSELQSLMRISYAVFCLKTRTHLRNQRTQKRIHICRTNILHKTQQ